MKELMYMAIAGGLGSVCRYGVTILTQRITGDTFPSGTFVVNILGCFLFGLVWGLLDHRIGLPPHTRLVVLTGFMGAFTTFSTYAFQSLALMQNGQWFFAAINVAGQVAGGVLLAFAGLALGRAL